MIGREGDTMKKFVIKDRRTGDIVSGFEEDVQELAKRLPNMNRVLKDRDLWVVEVETAYVGMSKHRTNPLKVMTSLESARAWLEERMKTDLTAYMVEREME